MGAQNKIAGYPYASVIVHHVTAAGQNVTGRRTNFIVITKNTGRQISDNVIIQDCKRIKLASKRRVIVFMLVASMILSIPVSAE